MQRTVLAIVAMLGSAIVGSLQAQTLPTVQVRSSQAGLSSGSGYLVSEGSSFDTFPVGTAEAYPSVTYAFQEQTSEGAAAAGGGDGGAENAGQQAQNPIADLVALPLQSNWNYGVGPDDRTLYIGFLQPVVPIKISENLNWITRPVIPFVNLPADPFGRTHGLGDIIWQNFFVPAPVEGSPWTWGVGPSINVATASDLRLGAQRWGVGVDGVVVYTKGPIVGGCLINQSYLETGNSQPFLLQPFFNYNFTEGLLKNWFINVGGEFQADWRSVGRDRWNNVLGMGPGKTTKLFGQPIQVLTRFGSYLDPSTGEPNWQFRLNVSLLFPK